MSCNSTSADLRPAQYNVKIWRNDTWSQVFSILADTTPVDLSGSTILIQVRPSANSTTIALALTTADSSILIGGVDNNQITLNKKADVAAGSYVYDMNVTFPTGEVKTYIWGNFIVQEDISKP
jgi:hypothetical protein